MTSKQNIKVIPCFVGDENIVKTWTQYFVGDASRQSAEATGKEPVEVWVVINGREYSGYAVA